MQLGVAIFILLAVSHAFLSRPIEANAPPHVTGYRPAPVASATAQVLTITGSSFAKPTANSAGVQARINGVVAGVTSSIESSSFVWSVVLPTSGAFTLTVRNPDGKTSSGFTVQVKAVPVPIPPTPTPIPPTPTPIPPQPTTGARVMPANLQYVGAIRVPQGTTGDGNGMGFSFAGAPIGINPATHGLFMSGYGGQILAELTLPAPAIGPLASLPTATFIQTFSDPTGGQWNQSGTGGTTPNALGGLIAIDGRLCFSGSIFYDANGSMSVSQGCRSTTLAQTSFTGWQAVGGAQGFVNMALAAIPTPWQTLLGGRALASGWGLPIISRESSGVNAISYDPAAITGAAAVAPATPLENYPGDHPTLGVWANTAVANPNFNMASWGDGMVIPPGWNSLLHFGRTGLGVPCYGEATGDPALVGTPVPGFLQDVYCYDPTDPSKGNHAYPYAYYVWAYDLNDLAKAKAGIVNAWDVLPYATWTLSLPFPEPSFKNLAATIDASTGLIYISQLRVDGGDYGYFAGPVIHVFKVQ